MLVNLLAKKNIFIKIFVILLFSLLGLTNLKSIDFSYLQLIGLSITAITIIYVGYIDQKNDLISKSSYPSFFYILWIMPFIDGLIDYKIAGSLLLMTYITAELLYFEVEKEDRNTAFDIGVFLGFAVLLNPPLIIVGVVIFAYFLTLRSIDSLIFLLAILGFLVPILAALQVSFLMGYDFLVDFYVNQMQFDYFQPEIKQIFLIPVLIFLGVAIVNHLSNLTKLSAPLKRVFFLLYSIFIALIVTYILYGGNNDSYLAFMTFSLMIVLTHFMTTNKGKMNWFKEGMLWSYMVCLLIYNFYDRIPRFFSLITEVSF